MSNYRDLFKGDPKKTICFLWKINRFGEVVVEHVDESIPGLVSTSRGMCCLGKADEGDFYESLNIAAKEVSGWRFVKPPGLWAYGVDSEEKLVQRLNSKGKNEAKIVWAAMPYELRPSNIKFDSESKSYVLITQTDGK